MDYGDGQTQGYSFDAMGNRLGKTDSAAGSSSYAFDAANRLTTVNGQAVTCDADGNTLTDASGRTSTWDSQNRMTGCTKGGVTSTYTYGADGLRRSSTVNGTTTYYVYDGSMLVREMQQNAQGILQSTATYLCGPRGPEYRRDDVHSEGTYMGAPAGTVRWYVYDGLGSVVGEVDPSGNLTATGKYDVYGAKRAGGTGTATSRQGFVGQLGHVTDTETGLVYIQARYYDPSTGRFVSEDPALNGTNWLCYANDNPVNEVDPTGKTNVWLEGGAAIMGMVCLTAAMLSPIPIAIDYGVKACAWFGVAIAFGATDKMPQGIAEIGALLAVGSAYFKDIATMIVATKLAQNFGVAQLDVVMVAACAEGFALIGEMACQDAGY